MNCRECKFQEWTVFQVNDNDRGIEWPCGKGVASLVDYVDPHGLGDLIQKRQVQRLPWLIQDHDCPEFEEAK